MGPGSQVTSGPNRRTIAGGSFRTRGRYPRIAGDGTVDKALFSITCTTCRARLAVRSAAMARSSSAPSAAAWSRSFRPRDGSPPSPKPASPNLAAGGVSLRIEGPPGETRTGAQRQPKASPSGSKSRLPAAAQTGSRRAPALPKAVDRAPSGSDPSVALGQFDRAGRGVPRRSPVAAGFQPGPLGCRRRQRPRPAAWWRLPRR